VGAPGLANKGVKIEMPKTPRELGCGEQCPMEGRGLPIKISILDVK